MMIVILLACAFLIGFAFGYLQPRGPEGDELAQSLPAVLQPSPPKPCNESKSVDLVRWRGERARRANG